MSLFFLLFIVSKERINACDATLDLAQLTQQNGTPAVASQVATSSHLRHKAMHTERYSMRPA